MSAILKRQIAAQKAAVAAAAAAAAGSGGSSAVNSGGAGAGAGTATVQLATGQQQQVQTGLSSAHLLAQAGLQVRVRFPRVLHCFHFYLLLINFNPLSVYLFCLPAKKNLVIKFRIQLIFFNQFLKLIKKNLI